MTGYTYKKLLEANPPNELSIDPNNVKDREKIISIGFRCFRSVYFKERELSLGERQLKRLLASLAIRVQRTCPRVKWESSFDDKGRIKPL